MRADGDELPALGLNLALGITLVPVLIGWVGADAMALILLIVAGTGFGMMFRELSRPAADPRARIG